MALPATISGISWSAWKNVEPGPFESGGNLYGVFVDTTNNHVEVHKSTNGGDSWAEVDSANHKSIYTDANFKSADAVQVGTMLHIGYWTGEGTIVVSQFSMATDTWGTSTGASTSDLSDNTDNVVGTTFPISLVVRSDGDYVVLTQGDRQAIMGTGYRRTNYRRHEGSTWTANISVGGTGSQIHYDPRAIAIDASDRAYLFYTDTTNSDLLCKTLTSTNTLNGVTTIDATANVGAYSAGHAAWVDDTTDKIVIPYVDSDGDTALAYANVADSPTWASAEFTSTNDAEYTNSNPGSIAVDGTDIYVLWPDDSTQDLWLDTAVSGTWSFTTDEEILDAVTINGISAGKITDAIGYFYLDGTTVKYNAYSLGGAGATGTVSAGSLSVSGQTVTATTGVVGTIATGSRSVSGQSITGTPTVAGNVATGSHAVTGQAVAATTGTAATVATGSLSIAGQTVAASTGVDADIGTGSLAVAGQPITGTTGHTGTIATGDLAVTGQTVDATTGVDADVSTGSLAVTGQTVTSTTGVVGTIATGDLSVSGQTVEGAESTTGEVATGSLSVTGQTITATTGTVAEIATGTLAVNGQTVTADPAVLATVDTGRLRVRSSAFASSGVESGSIAFGRTSPGYQMLAQGVTLSETKTIYGIELRIEYEQVPSDSVYVEIRSDNSGDPSGTVLSESDRILGATLASYDSDATMERRIFNIPGGYSMTAGTPYWIVIRRETLTANGEPRYMVGYDAGSPLGNGAIGVVFSGSWLSVGSVDFSIRLFDVEPIDATTGVVGEITTGTLSVSGQAVTGAWSDTGTVSTGELTVTGQTVDATTGTVAEIATGELAVSGQTVIGEDTGGETVTGTISTGTLSVTGQTVTGETGTAATIATGEHSVSGQTVTATTGVVAEVTTGSLSIDGQTVNATTGVTATVSSGELAVTGQTVLYVISVDGTITPTGYTVSGQIVGGYWSDTGLVSSGELVIAGQTIEGTGLSADVTGEIASGTMFVAGQTVTAILYEPIYTVVKPGASYGVAKPTTAYTVAKPVDALTVAKPGGTLAVRKSSGTLIVEKVPS